MRLTLVKYQEVLWLLQSTFNEHYTLQRPSVTIPHFPSLADLFLQGIWNTDLPRELQTSQEAIQKALQEPSTKAPKLGLVFEPHGPADNDPRNVAKIATPWEGCCPQIPCFAVLNPSTIVYPFCFGHLKLSTRVSPLRIGRKSKFQD